MPTTHNEEPYRADGVRSEEEEERGGRGGGGHMRGGGRDEEIRVCVC